jgi:hypothetical protein
MFESFLSFCRTVGAIISGILSALEACAALKAWFESRSSGGAQPA